MLTVESARAELDKLEQTIHAELVKLQAKGMDETRAWVAFSRGLAWRGEVHAGHPEKVERRRQLVDFLDLAPLAASGGGHLTIEDVRAEAAALEQRIHAEIWALMEKGMDSTLAWMTLSRTQPELFKREKQLKDFMDTAPPDLDVSVSNKSKEKKDVNGNSEMKQAEEQLDTLAKAKMSENSGLQYHEALKLVASENPELNRRYTRLVRARCGGDTED